MSINKGYASVSPLLMGLTLIEKSKQQLPDTFEFWNKFCKEYIEICNEVWVLDLEDWQRSKGVKQEIKWAKELNKPCILVDSQTLEILKLL